MTDTPKPGSLAWDEATYFKKGDRVVSRFRGHHLVKHSEVDDQNQEWVTVVTPSGKVREWAAAEFRPYDEEFHGEWNGPKS